MAYNISGQWQTPIRLKDGAPQNLILNCSDEDMASTPATPGVYIFGRFFGEKVVPLYVGQSTNLRARLKSHLKSSVQLMKRITDACLALYKYQTLINGKKIGAQDYTKVRWHIIQLFKWLCHRTTEVPSPNSKKAEAYANKLIDSLNSENKSYIEIFEQCQKIVDKVGFPTDDELKRGKFGQELLVEAKQQLAGSRSKS